jgi:hypothetical protein
MPLPDTTAQGWFSVCALQQGKSFPSNIAKNAERFSARNCGRTNGQGISPFEER